MLTLAKKYSAEAPWCHRAMAQKHLSHGGEIQIASFKISLILFGQEVRRYECIKIPFRSAGKRHN